MGIPTTEEVIQRYEDRKGSDLLGFEVHEYLPYTNWDYFKDKVKEGTKEAEFKDFFKPIDRDKLLKEMKNYMSFAWDKANNQRGISANRSIQHYIAWTWLIGDYEFSEKIDCEYGNNYHDYGMNILNLICEHYEWDSK